MLIFSKDKIDHETLYPCSPSVPDITSSCWSFARNETAEESCIIQLEPCDDGFSVQSNANDSNDQSEANDQSELKTNCVKIIDNIEFEDLKFNDGTPVICKDQMSFFLIGLSTDERKNATLIFQNVPGDLLNTISQHYKTGEPEMDSKNLQIDYEGTEFQEPEILPEISENNECYEDQNTDDRSDNSAYDAEDSNGNIHDAFKILFLRGC